VVPVGVNPPPDFSERFLKRSTEICEFVEVRGVDATGIEVSHDETVALGASQRIGKDFVGDSVECVVKVLVAATAVSKLAEDSQSPAPPDQPDEGRSPAPFDGHADDPLPLIWVTKAATPTVLAKQGTPTWDDSIRWLSGSRDGTLDPLARSGFQPTISRTSRRKYHLPSGTGTSTS